MRRKRQIHNMLAMQVAIVSLAIGVSCDIPTIPGGGGNTNTNNNGGGDDNNNNSNANTNNNDNENDNSGETCSTDPDCDDGLFCNGPERCVDNICEPGDSPCTVIQNCVEATQVCLDAVCETDDDCPSGLVCDELTGECLDISAGMCGPGAGLCLIENPTPGCESVECCELVCSFEPACCLSPWDDSCVDRAFQFCGGVLNP